MPKPANGSLPQSGSVVARWNLEESSGNASDSLGSNTLTDTNTVGSNASVPVDGFTQSRDFEAGNSEHFKRNDTADLSPTGDLTFTVWVNIESAPGTNVTYEIINKDDDNTNRDYRFRYQDSSGTKRFQFSCNSGGGLTSVQVNSDLGTATWRLVGFSYDASAGECDFYVDGAQVGSTQTGLPTSIRDGTGQFGLGAANVDATAINFFDGFMQDAIFWKGAELTAAEHSQLYSLYTQVPPAGSPIFFT